MTDTVARRPTDYGTDEIHQRHETQPELTGKGHAVRFRVRDGTEVDRLFGKGLLDQFEKSAGDTLTRDLHRCKMLGLKTMNLTGAGGGGGDVSETHAMALARVSQAISYLDDKVGVVDRMHTLNACLSACRIEGFDAIAGVRRGLNALLDHYDRRPTPRASE